MLCCSLMFVLLPCSTHKKKNPGWSNSGVFFMYLLFLGIVQNNTITLDDALTQRGKLCFWEKFKVVWHAFPSFLPRAFKLKRDHWLSEFSASATIKFQIGIVSFSLRLSCQILVHRLDLKELRLRIKTSRHWGGRSPGRGCPRKRRDFVFGFFRSLFLTSSAFHCFKGES